MKTPTQNQIPPGRTRVKLLSFLASITVLMTLVPTTQGKPTAPIRYDSLPMGGNLQSAYLVRARTVQPWGLGPRPSLQAHFADVLRILESDTERSIRTALGRLEASQDATWTVEERATWRQRLATERERNIAVLREYQARGLFPINDQNLSRSTPIFVDRHDTACAVGYLMRRSGAEQAVAAIVQANNFVYVPDVHAGPLVDWILASGLTQEEAALIQPTYQGIFTYISEGGEITITRYTVPYGAVNIPDSIDGLPVTRIGNGAFQGSHMTSVTVPKSVTSIGDRVFYGCPYVTAIAVDVMNPSYISLDGVLFDKSQASLIQYPARKPGRLYVIPDGVTSIGNGAFDLASSLTNIIIPDSVTSIGYVAFRNCSGLTNIVIPHGVTNIGNYAFEYCSRLTGVYFQGNAPTAGLIFFMNPPMTIYYLPGTAGWGATFGGRPTAPWFLPNPLILTSSPGPGVRDNEFGFTISWATNASVVVEACADLSVPDWLPVKTNTLTDGSLYFSDSEWSNHPNRFYRLRSP